MERGAFDGVHVGLAMGCTYVALVILRKLCHDTVNVICGSADHGRAGVKDGANGRGAVTTHESTTVDARLNTQGCIPSLSLGQGGR